MIKIIYIIILSYFVLGAAGFYFINRKKKKQEAQKNRTKFISYFFIIHLLFFSIVFYTPAFRYLAVLIILAGYFELFRLFRKENFGKKEFFILAVLVFTLFAFGFYLFSGIQKEHILFSFLILSIFDSFSQISGQLWGKTKILPEISPNKTVGGVVGGALTAIFSAYLLKELMPATLSEIFLITSGIVLFAFLGDISASYYKRRYNAKDFSNLIPGHGGFLDRFDSLIFGGAWVALYELTLKI